MESKGAYMKKQHKKIFFGMVLIGVFLCLLHQVAVVEFPRHDSVIVVQDGECIGLYENLLVEEVWENKTWVSNTNTSVEYSDAKIGQEVPIVYWNRETQLYIPNNVELNYIEVFENIGKRKNRGILTERFLTINQFEKYLTETERKSFYVSVVVTKKGRFFFSSFKQERMCEEYVFVLMHNGKFISNGKNEPYEQGIPLHEMDFSEYIKYEDFAVAPVIIKNDQVLIELPFDLHYYTYKTATEPAFTLKKGTQISRDSAFVVPNTSFVTNAYGLQAWPDYDLKWRYGRPFFSTDFNKKDMNDSLLMYYVKTEDLEAVARLFYMPKGNFITFSSFKYNTIGHLDKLLYEAGAFDSGY